MADRFEYSVLISMYWNDNLASVVRCTESIRGQIRKSNDVVIVLDGPVKPEVDEYITIHCHDWNIVRLSENVGLGAALSIGLPQCKNTWVMRIDADDTCVADRSEQLIRKLVGQDSDKIAAIGSYITEKNLETGEANLIRYPLKYCVDGRVNYFRDPIGHASAMINRDAVAKVGGYKSCMYFEDTYLWLRLLKSGYCLVTVPEPLYEASVDSEFYYRRSGVKYALIEFKNFVKFYRKGLITSWSFLKNIVLRPIVRLLPKPVVKKIYKTFLRSS